MAIKINEPQDTPTDLEEFDSVDAILGEFSEGDLLEDNDGDYFTIVQGGLVCLSLEFIWDFDGGEQTVKLRKAPAGKRVVIENQ